MNFTKIHEISHLWSPEKASPQVLIFYFIIISIYFIWQETHKPCNYPYSELKDISSIDYPNMAVFIFTTL